MPQWTAWKRYTREVVDRLPTRRGEYEIAARNKKVIANGSSNSESAGVRGRLVERLIHNRCPTGYFFRCRYADWLDNGLDMEAKTAARHKAKRGGRNLKDNKRSPRVYEYWGI
ncbi:MAG: hypothetical protein V1857_07230 [archaeon]